MVNGIFKAEDLNTLVDSLGFKGFKKVEDTEFREYSQERKVRYESDDYLLEGWVGLAQNGTLHSQLTLTANDLYARVAKTHGRIMFAVDTAGFGALDADEARVLADILKLSAEICDKMNNHFGPEVNNE